MSQRSHITHVSKVNHNKKEYLNPNLDDRSICFIKKVEISCSCGDFLLMD